MIDLEDLSAPVNVIDRGPSAAKEFGWYYWALRLLFVDDLLGPPAPAPPTWKFILRAALGTWPFCVGACLLMAQRQIRYEYDFLAWESVSANRLLQYGFGIASPFGISTFFFRIYATAYHRHKELVEVGEMTLPLVHQLGRMAVLVNLLLIPLLIAIPAVISLVLGPWPPIVLTYLAFIILVGSSFGLYTSFPFMQSLSLRYRFALLSREFLRVFEPGKHTYKQRRHKLYEIRQDRARLRKAVRQMMARSTVLVLPTILILLLFMFAVVMFIVSPDPFIYPNGRVGLLFFESIVLSCGLSGLGSLFCLAVAVPKPVLFLEVVGAARDEVPPPTDRDSPLFVEEQEYEKDLLRRDLDAFFLDCAVHPVTVLFGGFELSVNVLRILAAALITGLATLFVGLNNPVWQDGYCQPDQLRDLNITCSNRH